MALGGAKGGGVGLAPSQSHIELFVILSNASQCDLWGHILKANERRLG
jgi:hypothetical protein